MADSRSALLDAAAEEFARHGVKGARVQAIVTRAGVNERMIYHHFGSKAGLYGAVLEAQMEGLRSAWEPVLDKSLQMNPYAGMHSALAGYFDVLLARPVLVGLLLHEALGGRRTLLLPDTAPCIVALRKLYKRGQVEGVFRADCPFEVACVTATSALFGLLVLAPRTLVIAESGGRRPVDTPTLREQVLGQLLHGMSGPMSA
jgi:AcrR family transcriptional regulator